MTAHSCLTCGWAWWTSHIGGSCYWRPSTQPIPKAYCYSIPGPGSVIPFPDAGGFIDRSMPHTDCPCWKPKEELDAATRLQKVLQDVYSLLCRKMPYAMRDRLEYVRIDLELIRDSLDDVE